MSLLEVDSLHVEYERKGLPPVPAVAGVDLEVGRGQIVALVGESGCGKSTLARTVVGLLSPRLGEVRFEGRPVRPVSRGARPPEQVRLQMIFQDPYSSLNPRRRVESQILDGQRGLRGAGKRMQAGDLLERVGLPSVVAKRYPHEFSGGQRQRIAIARVVLKNAPILILDEATSSLDSVTEQAIQETLEEVMKGKTVIVVAHRLSTIAHLDRILVFDEGRIVEDGSHAELLSRGGAYQRLWSRQAGGFLLDDAASEAERDAPTPEFPVEGDAPEELIGHDRSRSKAV
jgi:ATP-binding cassette, subfamily B, bacterial